MSAVVNAADVLFWAILFVLTVTAVAWCIGRLVNGRES